MRQIERNMVRAIFDGKDWRNGNTAVEWFGVDYVHIRLHGHLIAEAVRTESGSWQLILDDCGWQTTTTKSRLNVLLRSLVHPSMGVVQDDWSWYLVGTDGTTRVGWMGRTPFVAPYLDEAFPTAEPLAG